MKDPAGPVAPRRQLLASRNAFVPNAATVKIRYGPYSVIDMMKKNSHGELGMLSNYPDKNVEKPCESCKIIGLTIGLEYADGKEANTDTDAWLHHMVLYNEGKDAIDATGTSVPVCETFDAMGLDPYKSERLIASGNEHTSATYNAPNPNATEYYGYPIYPNDKFHLQIELMNMAMKEKTLYITIIYDYVQGHPANFSDIKPVWFDAGLCSKEMSEVPAPVQTGNFTIVAKPWTSTLDGAIMGITGHLHDGGQSVGIDVDGQRVCDSVATYGGTPGSKSSKSPMGAGGATVHISGMSRCVGPTMPLKMVKKGQKWTLSAFYDYNKSLGMLEPDGKQSDVMGIAVMFFRRPTKRQGE